MGKPQMYLIGRAAKLAKMSTETARAYCRQGLLDPLRDSAGRRLFTDRDVETLKEIFRHNTERTRFPRQEESI